ncbi:hypothetical protein PUN28_016011 [Cardiocondyla obscurior]|uniref:Uncharacterized protein n=1 Tax=Cardiocondyla obscurior TaxID=286306 RepID=A0AAW2EVF3_9HYME
MYTTNFHNLIINLCTQTGHDSKLFRSSCAHSIKFFKPYYEIRDYNDKFRDRILGMLFLCDKPYRILDRWPVMHHHTIRRNVVCDVILHEHLLVLAKAQTEINILISIDDFFNIALQSSTKLFLTTVQVVSQSLVLLTDFV